jgi:hypothetical protein
MKLSFSNFSNKNVALSLLAALLVALYAFGVWYVKSLANDVRAQAVELSLETTRETSMRSLSGFLADLTGDEKKLSSFFVAPDNAVMMIETIERLGNLVGAPVSISGVRIEEQNQDTGEGTMTMNVSAEGTWREVSELLALLDTFPFASSVDNVTLVQIGEEKEQVWSFRAIMSVALRK